MASVSMAMPMKCATQNIIKSLATPMALINPLKLRPPKKAQPIMNSNSRAGRRVNLQASLKEKAITAAGLAASVAMMIPETAEAAGSGISPSLKNFLLSIASGGLVALVLVGAVIAVANFDPVKR